MAPIKLKPSVSNITDEQASGIRQSLGISDPLRIWANGFRGLSDPFPYMETAPTISTPQSASPSLGGVSAPNASYVYHDTDHMIVSHNIMEPDESDSDVGRPSGQTKLDDSKGSGGITGIRFATDAPEIEFCFWGPNQCRTQIIIDGEVRSTGNDFPLRSSSGRAYMKMTFGDGSNTKKFELLQGGNISGGTGYAAGDILTLSGGTASESAKLCASQVSGGVIGNFNQVSGGLYTARPTNPVSLTGGSGTGATLTDPVWGAVYDNRKLRYIELLLENSLAFKGVNVDTQSTVIPWHPSPMVPRMLVVGDSNTAGTYTTHTVGGIAQRIGKRLGLWDNLCVWAAGGSGWNQDASAIPKWSDSRSIADFNAYAPDIFLFIGSQNDDNNSTTQGVIEDTLGSLLDSNPRAYFVGIGPFICEGTSYTKAAWEAVQASNPSRVRYIDCENGEWLRGEGDIEDNTGSGNNELYVSNAGHCTQAGQTYWADVAAGYVANALLDIAT